MSRVSGTGVRNVLLVSAALPTSAAYPPRLSRKGRLSVSLSPDVYPTTFHGSRLLASSLSFAQIFHSSPDLFSTTTGARLPIPLRDTRTCVAARARGGLT